MKKLVLAIVMVAFGASAAYACDGMRDHARTDKGDQGAATAKAAKDSKGAAKADQKS